MGLQENYKLTLRGEKGSRWGDMGRERNRRERWRGRGIGGRDGEGEE